LPFAKDEKISTWTIAQHHALYDRVETYAKGPNAKPIPNVNEDRDIYGVMLARLRWDGAVRLRRLLEWLFTPIEMEACHLLRDFPLDEQAGNVAQWLDISVDQVNDILESCFQKGVIFPRDRKTRTGYRFLPRGQMQFHDGSQTNASLDMKYGPKLFNLWDDWCYHEDGEEDYNRQKKRFEAPTKYRNRRVLPAFDAILESPDVDQLQPWEDGREIINGHYRWAISPCSCRRRVSGGGMTCKRTTSQVCLNFDIAAETVILRHGREVSKEQALEAMRQAHRDGLVGSMNHWQTTDFFLMCFCCDCCCHHWAPHISQWGEYSPEWRWKQSRWNVSINQDKCIACKHPSGESRCVAVCQFKATEMREVEGKQKAFVDTEKCFGCLSCAVICPAKAITAHCVRPLDWVPVEPQRGRQRRIDGNLDMDE
jgi:NAD-dependent dihydropyrimidine dehydrogenase PreA subunit